MNALDVFFMLYSNVSKKTIMIMQLFKLIMIFFILQPVIPNEAGKEYYQKEKSRQSLIKQNTNFESVFVLDKVIKLHQDQTHYIGNISNLVVDKQGNFFVSDKLNANIKKYDTQGKLLQVIGRKGNGPGEFQSIFSLAIRDTVIYAVDPVARRVSILESTGKFLRSFRITDGREIIVLKSGELAIAALVITENERGYCIHLYTKEGNYLRSFFPIHERVIKNQMICDFVSLDKSSDGSICAVQEMDYTIYMYNPDGKFLKKIVNNNPQYIPPPEKAFDRFYSRKAVTEWSESWMHVHKLKILPNDIVVVSLLTFKPSKFMIDLYNKNGKPINVAIRTDFRLLNVDDDGRLYFLEEKEGDDGPKYFIRQYTLSKSILK
jgi:hypothetical protein